MFSPACIVEVFEIDIDVVAAYATSDRATIINSDGRKYLLLHTCPIFLKFEIQVVSDPLNKFT